MCQPQACPRENSSPIQASITKFGCEVQNNLVKVPIVSGAIDIDLQGFMVKISPILSLSKQGEI